MQVISTSVLNLARTGPKDKKSSEPWSAIQLYQNKILHLNIHTILVCNNMSSIGTLYVHYIVFLKLILIKAIAIRIIF
jgi:hypothetical protein